MWSNACKVGGRVITLSFMRFLEVSHHIILLNFVVI